MKLKRCPFCGSDAIAVVNTQEERCPGNRFMYKAKCVGYLCDAIQYAETLKMAIIAWNRRAKPTRRERG